MNIPSYVYQNGFGIYYFRIAIPKHLKPAFRKHEIRKSLKTTNYHYAVKETRRLAVITEQLFRSDACTLDDINSAFRSGAHNTPTMNNASGRGYRDYSGYRSAQTERDQIITHDQSTPAEITGTGYPDHRGYRSPQDNSPTENDVPGSGYRGYSGYRPLQTKQDQTITSTPQSLSEVTDTGYPNHRGNHSHQEIHHALQLEAISPTPVRQSTKNLIKLSTLIEQYIACQDVENSWQDKTQDENKAIFETLVEIVGDIDLDEIDHQTADTYRATLKRLPPNMKKVPKYRGKSVRQILALKPKHTLSDTSVNKYMRRISALFNWAVDRELVIKNYFRRKPIQESRRANEKRDMLTTEDLAALFNPERFHAEADQPFKFWTPLIALYTGARQNEIAQLDGADVREVHGVWCFRFITAKQKKYTERIVPIHSRLIELGIVEYAAKQPGKLFPELHERRDGYGQMVSKWYNRYRRRCGITAVRNKDFHSFRHTFSTELFRVGVNPTLIAELDGHVTGDGKRRTTTEEVYIKPSDVRMLREALERLDYGEAVAGVVSL